MFVDFDFCFASLFALEKVSLQTSLEKNSLNFADIFLLDVNFENLIIQLYVFIIFSILAKFQEK